MITAPADTYLRTLISADRGATWVEVSSNLDPTFALQDLAGGTFAYDYEFALAGVDDVAGTFLLVLRDGTDPTYMKVFTASGLDDWTHHADLDYHHGAGETLYHLGDRKSVV